MLEHLRHCICFPFPLRLAARMRGREGPWLQFRRSVLLHVQYLEKEGYASP